MNGELLIGAIFVLFSAAERFNTPETNRSSTTALRYYLASFCYLLVGMSLYSGLVFFPSVVDGIGHESAFAHWANNLGLPPAPLAALLLTVLLPKVPLLAEADAWIRTRLQEMGAIPHEARRLAAELRKSRFSASPHFRAEVTTRLLNAGFHPDDLLFDERHDLKYPWTKVSVLMVAIEEWETDRRFVGFLSRFAADFTELERRYRQLTPKVRYCLRLLHDVTTEGGSGKSDGVVLQFQADLTEQVSELLGSLYHFISRGLLQCGTTYGIRAAKLAALGFDRKAVTLKQKLNRDHLMILFGIIGVVILVGYALLPGSSTDSFGERLEKAMLISSLNIIAVICAVYPKERWKFAQWDHRTVRPAAFYFVAGLMAAGFSLVLNLLFQIFLHHGFGPAWVHFRFSYPWAFSSFTTAFMVAWMTDDQPASRLPRLSLRWVEGLTGAGALVLAHRAIYSFVAQSPASSAEHTLPPLPQILARAGIIGFVIGYLIPTWYREAPPESFPTADTESLSEGVQPAVAGA